ncbi:MAG TPA: hypothetical protein VGN96_02490 [Roseococcus sp.]|jgi:hypothetical protein|nr:hypothetical protein [Roseococcus sp.]
MLGRTASYILHISGKLTARTIASLTLKDRHTPGRHTDGDGLHLHTRTPETASRLRGRIEAVLDFARARGWRAGENPVASVEVVEIPVSAGV